jgi:hypothetical protein
MKSIKIVLFLIVVATAFTACSDESSTLGGGWVSSDFKSVVTDTCNVQLSTVKLDSVATSNLSSVQVGHYKGNNVGDINAEAFIEYNCAYFNRDYNTSYTVDSTTIKLRWQGDFMGDTTKVLPIKIYELSRNITLDNDGNLYNISPAISTYPKEWAQINTYVYPTLTKKQYEYRLPDSIGWRFLNKVLNTQGQNLMKNQQLFREYFRGLAFVPGDGVSILPNIQKGDSSLVLTIYYRADNNTSEQKLTFTPTTPSFSKVTQNVSSSNFSDFCNNPTNNTVVSYNTGNMSLTQGTTGYYTKIEFPNLPGLSLYGQVVSVTSATLYLYPAVGTYSRDLNTLPKELNAYTASSDNAISSVLKSGTGTNATTQNGNLKTDSDNPDIQYYSYDLTSFMQSNLSASNNSRQNIQLTLPSSSNNISCKPVLFSNQLFNNGSRNYKTKVVIKYTVYNSNKVM